MVLPGMAFSGISLDRINMIYLAMEVKNCSTVINVIFPHSRLRTEYLGGISDLHYHLLD